MGFHSSKALRKIWIPVLFICAVFANRNALASSPTRHLLLTKGDETQLNGGDFYWQRGNINRAILVWKQEASKYRARQKKEQEAETLLKVARGYISLGQFYSAIAELEKVIALKPSDTQILALTRKRLGNAYSGINKYNQAISNYQKSLEQEKSLYTTNNLVEVLIDRQKYNNFIASQARQVDSFDSDRVKYRNRAKQDRDTAMKYAEIALLMSNKTDLASVRALINQNNISEQNLSWQQLYKGERILSNVPFSRNLAFTMLNWADVDKGNKALWLQRALNVAKTLDDDYLKSYVFLELGYFAEQSGDLRGAIAYSEKAQLMAQSELINDSLFRAQQLAGRIYQKQGNSNAAINAYQGAIASFDLLRRDSLTIDIEQRINFSTEIEPIYRSALKLLLNRTKTRQADLASAISIFDKLRLVQLQNYFGDDCFEIVQENSSTLNNPLNKNTAAINSIILDNRVIFILQLPNGKLIKSETKIARVELVKQARRWNKELNNRSTFEFRDRSRLFYNLIIKPFESELEANDTEVLIFVHDGILRNLPMAAMYDGKEFLAQKWASVSSIGLNFSPSPEKKDEQSALAFGLQTKLPGWPLLKNVKSEIQNVQNIIGGDKFLDRQFTVDNLRSRLSENEYSVVHLATHGYFGGTAETSFILSYEQKISAIQLEDILSQSKEIPALLVLSACETALSNDSSLLGLSGIAIRSGVKFTLGSLWQVKDDEQSEFIEAFYSYWQNSEYNKAIALQKVQIEQINLLAHPQKWASVILLE